MVATISPYEALREVFLVSVQKKGGVSYNFACITEEISTIEFGDKDIDQMIMGCGATVVKFTPQGIGTITLKLYPLDETLTSGTATITGLAQIFMPQTADDTTQPSSVVFTKTRSLYQLTLLFADDLSTFNGYAGSALTNASGQGIRAYRINVINAYCTSYKPSWGDKILSAEVTFKFPPFGAGGTSNVTIATTDGTTALPVIATLW